MLEDAPNQLEALAACKEQLMGKLRELGATRGANGEDGDDDFDLGWPEPLQDLLVRVRRQEGWLEG